MSGEIESLPEASELVSVSSWLADKGWSEAGSGNISIRLERPPAGITREGHAQRLPLAAPDLGGSHLFITAAGGRSREMERELERGVGLFHVLHGGEKMVCVWGNPRVTSELAAHIAIQDMLAGRRPKHRVLLHTHPANVIALTHLPRLQDSRAISEALLRMQSEAHILFPDGVRYLSYGTPGSIELGTRSAEALQDTNVLLWHMHGAVATGGTLSRALDYLEYIDKMAEVYWILRAAGVNPRGMRDEDIQSSLEHFELWERHRRSASKRDRSPSL